jgi:hypothetical protein
MAKDLIDGTITNWLLCTCPEGRFIVGTIAADAKGRFKEGARMRTSLVITKGDILDGSVIETMNSRYQLGQRASDVSAADIFTAALINSSVLDASGNPVTHIRNEEPIVFSSKSASIH